MYQNFTPRPENKHDNGTSPLLIRDTSSFMFVVFYCYSLVFGGVVLPCCLGSPPVPQEVYVASWIFARRGVFFFCGWEKNGGETHMFPCLSAKLCFNSSSSYGKLIATFVWRGVWDSSILNWTLNFISSCFFGGLSLVFQSDAAGADRIQVEHWMLPRQDVVYCYVRTWARHFLGLSHLP